MAQRSARSDGFVAVRALSAHNGGFGRHGREQQRSAARQTRQKQRKEENARKMAGSRGNKCAASRAGTEGKIDSTARFVNAQILAANQQCSRVHRRDTTRKAATHPPSGRQDGWNSSRQAGK
jgi:hypothetical protein